MFVTTTRWVKVNDFTPARVKFTDNGSAIEIHFDGHRESGWTGPIMDIRVTEWDVYKKFRASLGEDGGLIINGRKLGLDESMVEALKEEIIRVKFGQ